MVQIAEEKRMPEWAHPVVAVLGGAVTGDRIELAGRLLEVADTILIGGGPANTFLSVKGGRVGRSETAREKYGLAREILDRAAEKGVKIFLPVDVFAANEMSPHAKPSLEGAMALFEDQIAMDIGPRTTELWQRPGRKSLSAAAAVLGQSAILAARSSSGMFWWKTLLFPHICKRAPLFTQFC